MILGGNETEVVHAILNESQTSGGNVLPQKGTAFISVKDRDKEKIFPNVLKLVKLGFKICATSGTAEFLNSKGIKCKVINKVSQGSPHIVEKLSSSSIDLVINTSEGTESISDSFSLRRSTLVNKIPYFTTLASANGCVEAIESIKKNTLKVKALQDI